MDGNNLRPVLSDPLVTMNMFVFLSTSQASCALLIFGCLLSHGDIYSDSVSWPTRLGR